MIMPAISAVFFFFIYCFLLFIQIPPPKITKNAGTTAITNILQKLASAAGIVKVDVSRLLLDIDIVLPSSFEHIQLTDAEINSKFAPDTIVFILSLNSVSDE